MIVCTKYLFSLLKKKVINITAHIKYLFSLLKKKVTNITARIKYLFSLFLLGYTFLGIVYPRDGSVFSNVCKKYNDSLVVHDAMILLFPFLVIFVFKYY